MAVKKKSSQTRRQRQQRKAVKTSAELEALKDIADDVIESDFVPYACLLDGSTIATKDGEVLQTIKITGLGYDGATKGDLRHAIRAAIRTAIPDESYAIWLHTLRRKQANTGRAHFPDAFSGKLDEAWRAAQPQSGSYANELYISIVKAGDSAAVLDRKVFVQSLLPRRDQKLRMAAMDGALQDLTAVTAEMVRQLSAFGASLLGLVERDGVFYSEQLEFLEKMINLEERAMPVCERDLSHELTSGEITFGFNAMEVRTASGVRRFAAILTLKEYKESTLKGIDQFLEIPCEVIISQCFDFAGGADAWEKYEKQARYLGYSGDKELAEWIEIDRLMADSDVHSFGQQQTTIFLIAPSVQQLESNVHLVQRALNRLGMVVIREDLRFEECYWSQLPANFPFISRKYHTDTQHLAGFANLQAAPMGNAAGSPWGAPVTVLKTVQDSPYYFNFHRGAAAHTIVMGQPGSGYQTFAHFLLAQARKLSLSLWYVDVSGHAEPFIRAMGGQYLTPGTPECGFNPLLLAPTPANREFLALWLSTLIDPTGLSLNRSTLDFFQSVLDRVLALPPEQRRMQRIVDMIREADGLMANILKNFVAGQVYGELFDHENDSFRPEQITAYNIGRWMEDPITRVPLTGYLLHRLTGAISGAPTYVVLDEGFRVLDTPLFSSRIGGWCDYLTQNNAATLLMTSAIEESASRAYTPVLSQKAATIFAFADSFADAGYAMGFGLTAEDMASLSVIAGDGAQVLQKRGDETLVMQTNLQALPAPLYKTLAGESAHPAEKSAADVLAELMGYNRQPA